MPSFRLIAFWELPCWCKNAILWKLLPAVCHKNVYKVCKDIGSLLGCLLRVDTTLVHPLIIRLHLNESQVSVKWLKHICALDRCDGNDYYLPLATNYRSIKKMAVLFIASCRPNVAVVFVDQFWTLKTINIKIKIQLWLKLVNKHSETKS